MSPSSGLDERTATVAPSRVWGSPGGHSHSVQFYEADGALLDELSRYIGSALGAGDAVVVVATEEHRCGLDARLRGWGIDVGGARACGRYVSLNAAETLAKCVPDSWPDAARFFDLFGGVLDRAAAATTANPPRVAVFGELVALLSARGNHQAAIYIEELWNELAKTHRFSLHCAYPIDCFDREDGGDSIARICATHSRVVPGESYTSLIDEDERHREIALLQQKARVLATEVAERRRAEEQLRERNRELSAALAARDEFLSVAAHELKTPLTSLRAFSHLLLRDARRGRGIAPERLEVALAAIELQTGNMNRLLSRLLNATQIEAGRLCVDPVRTDLAVLIRSLVARQHLTPDHRVVVEGPDSLAVEIDPVGFEQVVGSLLENAVRFSPRGGTVTVAFGRDENGGIRVSVTDEGVGVPADQREAVFDRFHQAHDEPHLSGMGLGLYVAQAIVGLHGGTVHVEDSDRCGARFIVSLPPSIADRQVASVA